MQLMAQQQQQQSAMMPSYPQPPYGRIDGLSGVTTPLLIACPLGHPALTAMPQMMPGPGPMPGYPVAPPMPQMYSTAPNPAFPYMQTVPPPNMRPNPMGECIHAGHKCVLIGCITRRYGA